MVVFKHSKSEAEWNNLYHSFEKGQKGKYQKIVDALYQKGESAVRDYAALVDDAVATGTLDAVPDYIAEMEDLRPLVEERVSNEAQQAMREAA